PKNGSAPFELTKEGCSPPDGVLAACESFLWRVRETKGRYAVYEGLSENFNAAVYVEDYYAKYILADGKTFTYHSGDAARRFGEPDRNYQRPLELMSDILEKSQELLEAPADFRFAFFGNSTEDVAAAYYYSPAVQPTLLRRIQYPEKGYFPATTDSFDQILADTVGE
ncbi:hypothetical protein FOZ63_030668, partial [Perkinsus olseni]